MFIIGTLGLATTSLWGDYARSILLAEFLAFGVIVLLRHWIYAVAVCRRLRDLDITAWYAIPVVLLGIFGSPNGFTLAGMISKHLTAAPPDETLLPIGNLVILLLLVSFRGTRGANRFGT
jgi:uncharacterized membrane protein YhaH (DUF805 family)